MQHSFGGIFKGKDVLITGHTGFKGSWLAIWLQALGANVIGYSLLPPTSPNNFEVVCAEEGMVSIHGDIRDFEAFHDVLQKYRPEVIFHLAAQSIVLRSYEFPKETFDTNVGGTINVLEAARRCSSVRAMVMVTSDKCYENREWTWGYRENDSLGGIDPYSASKCMAEKAIASYRTTFCADAAFPAIGSARAGNVIGGGDFSDLRIVPDCMKALMTCQSIKVRNPKSVRPWLNVLDPLSGYLWLAAKLLKHQNSFAEAWNFGPLEHQGVNVKTLVEAIIHFWGEGSWVDLSGPETKPETAMLRLNWDKAATCLQWQPTYSWTKAIQQTVDWFRKFQSLGSRPSKEMQEVCLDHIMHFTEEARKKGNSWANFEAHLAPKCAHFCAR